ncbi:hypothetical protein J7G16_004586 [Vibrio parahaemolyticus]|nr:hypothetical protein [Vibrio parahaemolyticus]
MELLQMVPSVDSIIASTCISSVSNPTDFNFDAWIALDPIPKHGPV